MLKGPDALLEIKESIMSSISSFVTGYRNNDWVLGFFKWSLENLKVSGISLFTVLATLTKKLLKALTIYFGSLRSLSCTEIWEINLDEDCWVLTIFLIPDQTFFILVLCWSKQFLKSSYLDFLFSYNAFQ